MLPSLSSLSLARVEPTGATMGLPLGVPLVVLFDYDQCLEKVLLQKSDLPAAPSLHRFVVRLIAEAAAKIDTKTVVLLSYSNRVSRDYTVHIQPEKIDDTGPEPTKIGIAHLAYTLETNLSSRGIKIEPRHGLRDREKNDGYLVDGNAKFQAFGEDWREKKVEVKTALTKGKFGVDLKTELYITAKQDNPGAVFLVIDDKWRNLEEPMRYATLDTTDTIVVHLYGTQAANFLHKTVNGKALLDADSDTFWNDVVNKEDWFVTTSMR